MAFLSLPEALTVTWEILGVNFSGSDVPEHVSQPFVSSLYWDASSLRRGPGPAEMRNLLLSIAAKLGGMFEPEQPIQRCVGAYEFWQDSNISIFSQKVSRKGSWQVARCLVTQPSSSAVSRSARIGAMMHYLLLWMLAASSQSCFTGLPVL